jgi:hypothetical protein
VDSVVESPGSYPARRPADPVLLKT